ncbi:MarR family winged helix-turn-helix transcriptional regulator [uncultured Massilia sp.]|uniref:MarR family winged helix-turn-helix transcriptional regulator n=1 Tax=uncultured Massilia sp. TaxID=169973 RepID=UPI0025E41BD6|nr:MarR family transcriptional regulator [uncultured Massilia sp.]
MADRTPTSSFCSTEQRLQRVQARVPGFPYVQMRLVRMTYRLQKTLRDKTNAALKKYALGDTHYLVLAILYGSLDETSTATELSEACNEKPANLTRVCDELAAKGFIRRSPKPGDRRAVMISLCDPGRSLIEQILPEVSADVTSGYASLTPAELEQLASLTARVLDEIDRCD